MSRASPLPLPVPHDPLLDCPRPLSKPYWVTALSVSLDELAIGFSMGALGLPIGITVALIAVQAFALTLLGTAIGNRVGENLAERTETVAGLVLCGLAIALSIEKLSGG